MNKITLLLLAFFVTLSCSNNDKKVSDLINNKVETMSGREIVTDLLIENDGDEVQLARIFNCSVPTIHRILNKETYLTDNAISEFRNLLVAVKVSGEDTFKENDPFYESWIRSFRYWLDTYVFWAIGAGICIWIILLFTPEILIGFIPLEIIIVLSPICFFTIAYIVTWLANMFFPYIPPANLFFEQINPLFETLI